MTDPETIGWLVFIERVIGHIAWPSALFASSVVFRAQIVRVFGRLKSIKHKDTEVTFSELLDEASQEAATLPKPDDLALDMSNFDRKLISDYPHLAISEAWRRLENIVGDIVAVQLPRLPGRELHGVAGIRNLQRLELADQSLIRLLDDLRKVRNNAVHSWDEDITEGQALEFISLASRVERELNEIKERAWKID